MIFYMIRDKKTGEWYKRGSNNGSWWADQCKASVWTTLAGPRGVLGKLTRYANTVKALRLKAVERVPEVVPIHAAPGESSPAPRVTFVDGDDWEGLYIDGKLVEEHHHVRLEDIFKHLGIEATFIFPDQQWLEERGNLPENLEDVKRG